jgi:hypothetical protein
MGVEFKWRSDGAQIIHSEPEPPWRSRRGRRWLLAVFLALFTLAGGIHLRAQRGLAIARADLQRIILGQVLALQTGQRDPFLAALDDTHTPWVRYHEANFDRESAWYAARAAARPQIESLHLKSGQARVGIVLVDGEHTWRSTWFFKQIDGRWRHAPPPSGFWGETSEFAGEHITLLAQGPDRTPAARLAAGLDKLYAELAALYPPRSSTHTSRRDGDAAGLRRLPAGSHLTIRSFPYGDPGSGASHFPSPQLALQMWTPEERAAALGRSARLAVTRAVLQQALGRSQPAPGDWWLLEALALWHASAWEPEWQAQIQASLAAGAVERLLDVRVHGDEVRLSSARGQAPPDLTWVQPLAYTLGEYIGLNHPPEALSALVQTIGSGSSSWAALTSTLGCSRAELQAGWAAFVRERYGAAG